MMSRCLVLCLLLFQNNYLFAQKFLNAQNARKYKASDVVSADFGIVIYEKLNKAIAGDSTRYDYRKIPCQGWVEDYYENEKLLHKGNYIDGKLNIYKNYYENGQVERSFEVTGLDKFYMKVCYPDGKVRAILHYKGGVIQKEENFYQNGNLDFVEEQSKDLECVLQRKSFYENGNPQDAFVLVNSKKKIYEKKEYFDNGKLKELGTMVFNREVVDYQKDGVWKIYDESGKLLSEENYVFGVLSAKMETSAKAPEKNSKNKKSETPVVVSKGLPAEFKVADTNKDGSISSAEINACIDAYFDDKGNYTPEKINKLIDYFFE